MTERTDVEIEVYGGYAELLGDHPLWRIGTFPLAGGRRWEMREPEAVMIVREGNLSIGVSELSRSHDRAQILDNAKHVLFSTRTFSIPSEGAISFELSMRVRRKGAVPTDLYDGYGSFLCLDFSTGTAMDFFLAEDICAPTFARLPFPGLELGDVTPAKYWAIFRERELASTSDGFHRLRLEIAPKSALRWWADGEEIATQPVPPYELGPLTLGLAIMTEKDIGPTGSVSLHGQGVSAQWSPIEVRRRADPR